MAHFFKDLFIELSVKENYADLLSIIISFITVLAIILILHYILKKFLLAFLESQFHKSKNKWDDIIIKRKVLNTLIHVFPAMIIHFFAPVFPLFEEFLKRAAFIYILIVISISLGKLTDVADDIYSTFEVSRTKPIKGYLQVIKIFLFIIGAVIIISVIMDKSPWLLLSGIGAATAIILLIFQNSILGLVASIQLNSNDMVRIGDWIEMPKYGADGDVIEISLHTVKVQNWDKTITTIPTHNMVADSFKNWRGMQQSGGRRIKRCIYIDMTTIKFCDAEMLERFMKIRYIKDYINEKRKEIDSYNKEHNIDSSSMVNGRHLTNIGTFRSYAEHYLKNHPKVNPQMIQMVRQLSPSEKGLPLEIYCFTNDIAWISYEKIQSDIFDHLLSVIEEFDLKVFQNPSTYDFRSLYESQS